MKSGQPMQYPIPNNLRIQAYIAELEAKGNKQHKKCDHIAGRAILLNFIYFSCLLDIGQFRLSAFILDLTQRPAIVILFILNPFYNWDR